jgi:hypothetical protein
MDPEPVKPNFLNARDFHRGIHMPLGLGAKLAATRQHRPQERSAARFCSCSEKAM